MKVILTLTFLSIALAFGLDEMDKMQKMTEPNKVELSGFHDPEKVFSFDITYYTLYSGFDAQCTTLKEQLTRVAHQWQKYALSSQVKCGEMWNPDKPICKQLPKQVQIRHVKCSKDGPQVGLCRSLDIWKNECKVFAHYKVPMLDENNRTELKALPDAKFFQQMALIEKNLGHPSHFIKTNEPLIKVITHLDDEFKVRHYLNGFLLKAEFDVGENGDDVIEKGQIRVTYGDNKEVLTTAKDFVSTIETAVKEATSWEHEKRTRKEDL